MSALATTATAQPATEGSAADPQQLPPVTVTGKPSPGSTPDIAPRSTLSGPRLRDRATGTLGATLQDQPGLGNASFGPAVGQPVIRGQSGSRVRILQNGTGTHDASSLSADHGVMVEPALAQSVTVHRGPAAIRFGGNAIGGAVEIDEQRIPMVRPPEMFGQAILQAGNDGHVGLVRLDGPAGESLAWHVDVHRRDRPDTQIPGWALDEAAIREQFHLQPDRNYWRRIENSDARIEGGAAALSLFGDRGVLGVSASQLSQNYGIPPGAHSHGPANIGNDAPDERVRIQARQQRFDLRGESDLPWTATRQLRGSLTHVDYEHDEYDEIRPQEISTHFSNRVLEGSIELDYALLGWMPGTIGLQSQGRLFSALGSEAFIPETRVYGLGLFAVQRVDWGEWQLEAGLRADFQTSRPPDTFMVEALGGEVALQTRRFWPGSLSVAVQRLYRDASDDGALLPAYDGSITLTHWRIGRAPDIQELFSGGPHIATRTFDLGNNGLDIEKLVGWDLAWEHQQGRLSWRANVWQYDSDSYIYQRSLGWFYRPEEGKITFLCVRLDHCLPATKYEQAPARLYGYELAVDYRLPWELAGTPTLTFFSDAVRARLDDGSNVPRMPPQRYGLALGIDSSDWGGEIRATWARAQTHPGENETATPGWFQWQASVYRSWWLSGGGELTLFLTGRNLSNQEVRNSASFLRNYAPEPGRTLQIGMEISL